MVLLLLYCSRVGSLNENTAQNQFKYAVLKICAKVGKNFQMIINVSGHILGKNEIQCTIVCG